MPRSQSVIPVIRLPDILTLVITDAMMLYISSQVKVLVQKAAIVSWDPPAVVSWNSVWCILGHNFSPAGLSREWIDGGHLHLILSLVEAFHINGISQ